MNSVLPIASRYFNQFAAEMLGVSVSPQVMRWNLETPPLPLADRSCAAVVCVGVLSFVEQFKVVFGEWCRITKNKGVVAL